MAITHRTIALNVRRLRTPIILSLALALSVTGAIACSADEPSGNGTGNVPALQSVRSMDPPVTSTRNTTSAGLLKPTDPAALTESVRSTPDPRYTPSPTPSALIQPVTTDPPKPTVHVPNPEPVTADASPSAHQETCLIPFLNWLIETPWTTAEDLQTGLDGFYSSNSECDQTEFAPEFFANPICRDENRVGGMRVGESSFSVGESYNYNLGLSRTGRSGSGSMLIHFLKLPDSPNGGCWYYHGGSGRWRGTEVETGPSGRIQTNLQMPAIPTPAPSASGASDHKARTPTPVPGPYWESFTQAEYDQFLPPKGAIQWPGQGTCRIFGQIIRGRNTYPLNDSTPDGIKSKLQWVPGEFPDGELFTRAVGPRSAELMEQEQPDLFKPRYGHVEQFCGFAEALHPEIPVIRTTFEFNARTGEGWKDDRGTTIYEWDAYRVEIRYILVDDLEHRLPSFRYRMEQHGPILIEKMQSPCDRTSMRISAEQYCQTAP